ncbi:hypothetical protein BS50DRAFT_567908 [Corynespora cassiicola Philippines]|uniref:Uncharacterized protein n=1 Tax=Corynespora cassiicola Philippines TaxID=1448308 RepID=A0A2T2PC41_CORCC|nr:hypothetical protein BS50DRAFT_567908 [Corynespora cassiicola Philippines]
MSILTWFYQDKKSATERTSVIQKFSIMPPKRRVTHIKPKIHETLDYIDARRGITSLTDVFYPGLYPENERNPAKWGAGFIQGLQCLEFFDDNIIHVRRRLQEEVDRRVSAKRRSTRKVTYLTQEDLDAVYSWYLSSSTSETGASDEEETVKMHAASPRATLTPTAQRVTVASRAKTVPKARTNMHSVDGKVGYQGVNRLATPNRSFVLPMPSATTVLPSKQVPQSRIGILGSGILTEGKRSASSLEYQSAKRVELASSQPNVQDSPPEDEDLYLILKELPGIPMDMTADEQLELIERREMMVDAIEERFKSMGKVERLLSQETDLQRKAPVRGLREGLRFSRGTLEGRR